MPTSRFANNEVVIKGDRRGFVNRSTYDANTNSYTVNVSFRETRRYRLVSTPQGAQSQQYWSNDLSGPAEDIPEGELERDPDS